jgi:hypothetical protein
MKVRVIMRDRTWRVVEAIGHYGAFAIHESLDRDSLGHAGCYTITHLATGKRAWAANSLGEAVKVARYLDEDGPIPSGSEAVDWVNKLSAKQRTDLFYRLQQLAPRPISEDK